MTRSWFGRKYNAESSVFGATFSRGNLLVLEEKAERLRVLIILQTFLPGEWTKVKVQGPLQRSPGHFPCHVDLET